MAGTVATLTVSEDRLNVMPPVGAAAEMVRVTFTVLVAFTLMELGLSEPVAVICVAPIDTPVTWGFAAGMRRPAGTKTLGVIVATEVFALLKLTVRPPA